MLTLAAGETIAGVASVASSITYSFFGMELNAGVEAYKTLAQGQLAAAAATVYTAAASTEVFFKSIHLVNVTASDVSGVKLYQTGTTSGKQITGSMTIPANGWATFEEDGWRIYNASGELLQKISGTGVALVGTFPFDTPPQFSGDGNLYGLPGFTPINVSSYTFTAGQKAVVQPFRVKSRITISDLYFNVTTAKTTSGLRFMIYKANFTNGAIISLGDQVYASSLNTSLGNSTGVKNISSVNTVLEQGNYALVIAQAAGGTGSNLALSTIIGTMEGSELAAPSGSAWRANTELGYTAVDVATTPPNPWSGTLVAAATTWNPLAASPNGVAYPALVIMKYQFTNPVVSVAAGGNLSPIPYKSSNWIGMPDNEMDGTTTGTLIPANQILLTPFRAPCDMTIKGLGGLCTTGQAGNVQFAIYDADVVSGYPAGAALGSTASISASATGIKSALMGNTVALTGGKLYWIGVNASVANIGMLKLSYHAGMIYLVGDPTTTNVLSTGNPPIGGVRSSAQTFGTWPNLTSGGFTWTVMSATSVCYFMMQIN